SQAAPHGGVAIDGAREMPDVARSQSANCVLHSFWAFRKAARKLASSASGFSRESSLRLVIQPSPMASLIVRASGTLQSRSQRRGVTPLVLLLKRSGNTVARSLTVVVRRSRE